MCTQALLVEWVASVAACIPVVVKAGVLPLGPIGLIAAETAVTIAFLKASALWALAVKVRPLPASSVLRPWQQLAKILRSTPTECTQALLDASQLNEYSNGGSSVWLWETCDPWLEQTAAACCRQHISGGRHRVNVSTVTLCRTFCHRISHLRAVDSNYGGLARTRRRCCRTASGTGADGRGKRKGSTGALGRIVGEAVGNPVLQRERPAPAFWQRQHRGPSAALL